VAEELRLKAQELPGTPGARAGGGPERGFGADSNS